MSPETLSQALLGPSGAGKSTLMDILAQRKSTGHLSGELLVNGAPAHAGFVRMTSYGAPRPRLGPGAARGWVGSTEGARTWSRRALGMARTAAATAALPPTAIPPALAPSPSARSPAA